MNKFQKIISRISLVGLVLAAACNSKVEEGDTEAAFTIGNVAVSAFSLTSDANVLENLDSVFFSIDLDSGVIFNADSLPKGTNVSRLIPVITFSSTMTKVELTFNKDNLSDTTINYLEHETDSIDFTYPVKMNVTAYDGVSSFEYTIKVNVHQIDPDSLIWDNLAVSSLPSRYQNPVAQKTLFAENRIYSLVEEYNGEYTLSVTDDINQEDWTNQDLEFTFTPDIDTFSYSGDSFFIMDENGNLYESPDAMEWEDTGEKWISVIGDFGGLLLGIKETDDELVHCSYPENNEIPETPVSADFPISGRSSFNLLDVTWTNSKVGILAGGIQENGDLTGTIWGFDGTSWAVLNKTELPAVESPMLAHYQVYKETQTMFKQRAFDAWLLFGGKDENGDLNEDMYVSLDNGITWTIATEYMQLPDAIPNYYAADILVIDKELSSDLRTEWRELATKGFSTRAGISYTIDGYDITWQCPYLYIFGGYGTDNILSTSLWRGVLARLSFTPII